MTVRTAARSAGDHVATGPNGVAGQSLVWCAALVASFPPNNPMPDQPPARAIPATHSCHGEIQHEQTSPTEAIPPGCLLNRPARY